MMTLADAKAAVLTLPPAELAELDAFLHEVQTVRTGEPEAVELYQRLGFLPFPRRAARR